jgi:flagellar hook-associated protein 3 FlgL
MLYDQGLGGIQKLQAAQLVTNQQVATGRRVVTPSDDPIAAASVLELTQSMAVNDQNSKNAGSATDKLQMEDSTLTAIQGLIESAKTSGVEAGNTLLTDSDRASIATDLESQYQALLAQANTTDGTGQYQFSGYKGSAVPFSETSPGNVVYNGDQGQRTMRINAQRQVAVSDSGADVFQRIKNGNGTFVTAAAAGNTGTGIVSQGNMLDKTLWNGATNNKDFTIKFDVNNAATPSVTTYDIIDNVSGNSLLTGAAPGAAPYPRTYTSGSTISLKTVSPPDTNPAPFDYGAELKIDGDPATGDTFTVAASKNVDLFKTLSDMINVLKNPASSTAITNGMNTAMQSLDNALDNILTVRAAVGGRMTEATSVQSTGSDLDIQYKSSISQLQDVDYTKALSDVTQQQTQLQAALQAFTKTQGLSLFNYIQ